MRKMSFMAIRIFVTGATGFIGSATVRELLSAGHQVLGLVRSDPNADALAAMGATVVRGSLEDIASLRRGAEAADGVIHTAFGHGDVTKFAESCAIDQRAIATIGEVLAGSPEPAVRGHVRHAHRDGPRRDRRRRRRAHEPRLRAARARRRHHARPRRARGTRSSLVRLPRCVHGASEHGWRGGLVHARLDRRSPRGKNVAAYIGDGTPSAKPAVHRLDATRLLPTRDRKGTCAGSRLHATADEGVTMHDLAAAIGRRLGLPVASKSPDEVAAHFGFYGPIIAADQPASSIEHARPAGAGGHRSRACSPTTSASPRRTARSSPCSDVGRGTHCFLPGHDNPHPPLLHLPPPPSYLPRVSNPATTRAATPRRARLPPTPRPDSLKHRAPPKPTSSQPSAPRAVDTCCWLR